MSLASMTGQGAGEAELPDATVRVEIRSVNHKNLDVRVRAAGALVPHVHAVEERVRKALGRGRVEVQLQLVGGDVAPVRLDVIRAKRAMADLTALRDAVSPEAEVPLSLLSAVPDLFRPGADADPEAERGAVLAATDAACAAVEAMRHAEGSALTADLVNRAAELRTALAAARVRVPASVDAMRTRLQQRVAKLLEGTEITIDPARLEQEVVLFADRSDVSEELTRLNSHLGQLDGMLGAGRADTGKRLEFLLQEIHREVNTLGAKSADAELAQHVVTMKTAVSRMKEQAANVR